VTAADEESAVDETEDADDGGNSTGFGTKAKSLVKGKFVIEEEDLEGPLYELEMALLSSDVEMGVAEEILDNIRDEPARRDPDLHDLDGRSRRGGAAQRDLRRDQRRTVRLR